MAEPEAENDQEGRVARGMAVDLGHAALGEPFLEREPVQPAHGDDQTSKNIWQLEIDPGMPTPTGAP